MLQYMKKFLDKYYHLSKPAKASIWFVICYIIQRGIQFIGMPIFTRMMSTEEYGRYSIFLSWFNIICIFSSLNIYSGTFNKAMVKYEDSRKEYMSSVQYLTTITTLIISIFFLIFHNAIEKLTGFSFLIIILMCIHLLSFPTLQYWSQEQRFKYQYWPMIIVTTVNSLLTLILGIISVKIFNNKSLSLILVTVIIQCIICIIMYIKIAFEGKKVYSKEYWKWSISLAVPLIPHYLSEVLLGHSDRIMINKMCGPSESGIYNIVYQISMFMTIIRTGINGAFAPWLYESIKKKRYADIKSITTFLTIMMGTFSTLLMLIGPEILKIAAPNRYYEAVVDIPAIMIGCFFMFVYIMFAYIEIYYEEKKYVTTASIISAIINIFLNVIFINKVGYLAAGYTTMVSYVIMTLLHYIFLRRITNKYYEIDMMFNKKIIGIFGIIMIFSIFPMILIYKNIIIRYFVLIAILLILLIKRKIIIKYINQLKGKE